MGVATGCGCKEVYRFPHTTPLVSVLFSSSIPIYFFVHLKKCFSFLFQYFLKITFLVTNNFFTQYKHTYGQLRASHGSHII